MIERPYSDRMANMWLCHMTTWRNGDISRLFQLFGTSHEIMENLQEEIIRERLADNNVLKEDTCEEIRALDIDSWYGRLQENMLKNDIKCTTLADEDYPERLRYISGSPVCLYYKGDISITSRDSIIAIVGSRRPTYYGTSQADEYSRELSSRGVVIVSGMAYGIDSAAHRAAIEAGGATIAVLGGGVDICYPRDNLEIYHEMCDNHLVISEYEPGVSHIGLHFPHRNRIISGLSDGVLLVEAALRSGTLITADMALEQGKTVYGIPGRSTDVMSRGVNNMIKQGAVLVDSPSDIIMNIFSGSFDYKTPVSRRRNAVLTVDEKRIIGNLGYEPTYIDDIIRDNKMAIGETIRMLSTLESKGYIKCVEKGYYVLK